MGRYLFSSAVFFVLSFFRRTTKWTNEAMFRGLLTDELPVIAEGQAACGAGRRSRSFVAWTGWQAS